MSLTVIQKATTLDGEDVALVARHPGTSKPAEFQADAKAIFNLLFRVIPGPVFNKVRTLLIQAGLICQGDIDQALEQKRLENLAEVAATKREEVEEEGLLASSRTMLRVGEDV